MYNRFGLAMLLGLLWVSCCLQSCQPKKSSTEPTTNQSPRQEEKTPTLDDLFEEDKQTKEPTSPNDETSEETLDDLFGEDGSTSSEDTSNGDRPASEQAGEKKTEQDETSGQRPASYDDSQVEPPLSIRDQEAPHFLVLAGTFLNLMNAEREAARLQALGFDAAEVREFDLSEYHVVVAGRFRDLPAAKRLARDLVDKAGVPGAYVHRQRSKYFGNSPFEDEPLYEALP